MTSTPGIAFHGNCRHAVKLRDQRKHLNNLEYFEHSEPESGLNIDVGVESLIVGVLTR
jgi:hypothetical protein